MGVGHSTGCNAMVRQDKLVSDGIIIAEAIHNCDGRAHIKTQAHRVCVCQQKFKKVTQNITLSTKEFLQNSSNHYLFITFYLRNVLTVKLDFFSVLQALFKNTLDSCSCQTRCDGARGINAAAGVCLIIFERIHYSAVCVFVCE